MAGYTQQYDTDGMRLKADEITRLASEYEQVMTKLTNLVNNLEQVWNAPATQTFQASYAEFQATFKTFENKMTNYATELTRAANAQDEKNANDDANARRVNG